MLPVQKVVNRMRIPFKSYLEVLIFAIAATPLLSQVKPVAASDRLAGINSMTGSTGIQSAESATKPERKAEYVLGPEDEITIRAFQADEIPDKPLQISGNGSISVPLIGTVEAAGLTVGQLEREITRRLATYIEHPQVTVFVSDYRSQPVSVVGAVNKPGVVQLRGPKSLVEVISLAGGLAPDAGSAITVTRQMAKGKIPLENAIDDSSGRFSIVHLRLHDVMEAKTPADNILVQSEDVVTVARAQMVYVMGEVERPGGYVLNDRESLSLLQALSLAGGMKPTASAKKTKVLREEKGKAERVEVTSNVPRILSGDAPDMQLHADDILFIPNNLPKSASMRAIEMAIQMGTGLVIWRR